MKKLLALTLAAIIVLSLAACSVSINTGSSSGNDNNNTTSSQEDAAKENAASSSASTKATSSAASKSDSSAAKSGGIMSTDEFAEFIKGYVDISHYKADDPTDKTCSYSLKSDYYQDYQNDKSKHLFSDDSVKLDGSSTIKLNMQVSDFISEGWSFKDSSKASEDMGSMLESSYLSFTKGGKEIGVRCLNDTDSTLKYDKTKVGGFQLPIYGSDNNYATKRNTAVDFNIDGKIKTATTLKDAISALGEPKTIFYGVQTGYSHIKIEYQDKYEAGLHFVSLDFSGDGSKIVEVTINS